ncbi:hypothetical protein GCM10008985_07790 [Halococcus dombrowskii]|uniref:Transposase n=1 Tax=Halococcus dombrowskii TaxID=179637 RepID=A0AAV3SD12_HALDO
MDAADHVTGIETKPSPITINRCAKEYGSKLKQFRPDYVARTDTDAIITDGTKCHSRDEIVRTTPSKQRLAKIAGDLRSMLNLPVNGDWNEIVSKL